jgi:glutathione peroxidase
VTFTMLAPTHVRGEKANVLFKALAEKSEAPSWNFNKYLLNNEGQFVEHFGSKVKPDAPELISGIDALM